MKKAEAIQLKNQYPDIYKYLQENYPFPVHLGESDVESDCYQDQFNRQNYVKTMQEFGEIWDSLKKVIRIERNIELQLEKE